MKFRSVRRSYRSRRTAGGDTHPAAGINCRAVRYAAGEDVHKAAGINCRAVRHATGGYIHAIVG